MDVNLAIIILRFIFILMECILVNKDENFMDRVTAKSAKCTSQKLHHIQYLTNGHVIILVSVTEFSSF